MIRRPATSAQVSPSIRFVASPLKKEMLEPLSDEVRVVQFNSLLTDHDFERVAKLLRGHPHVALRAYGSYDGSITDLEFLRFFPFLRRFAADALFNSLGSLDGLRHLPAALEGLTLGQTRKRLSLRRLERFTNLHRLYLEGRTKDIEVVSGLHSLTDLTLRSITLPDLTLLTPLHRLRALDLKLGGTKELGLLPEIGKIEYLEIWMVKGFSNLGPLGNMPSLRFLFLQALKNVEDLSALTSVSTLRGLHLETMKGVRDLTPLQDVPLEQLLLLDMKQLKAEDVEPLVGHPTLKEVRIGLGSIAKNDQVNALLGLPNTARSKPDWRPG